MKIYIFTQWSSERNNQIAPFVNVSVSTLNFGYFSSTKGFCTEVLRSGVSTLSTVHRLIVSCRYIYKFSVFIPTSSILIYMLRYSVRLTPDAVTSYFIHRFRCRRTDIQEKSFHLSRKIKTSKQSCISHVLTKLGLSLCLVENTRQPIAHFLVKLISLFHFLFSFPNVGLNENNPYSHTQQCERQKTDTKNYRQFVCNKWLSCFSLNKMKLNN